MSADDGRYLRIERRCRDLESRLALTTTSPPPRAWLRDLDRKLREFLDEEYLKSLRGNAPPPASEAHSAAATLLERIRGLLLYRPGRSALRVIRGGVA